RSGAGDIRTDAPAIIDQFTLQLRCVASAAYPKRDAATIWLAGPTTLFDGLNAMIDSVTQQVLQRRHQPFEQQAVQLQSPTLHLKPHLPVQFVGMAGGQALQPGTHAIKAYCS